MVINGEQPGDQADEGDELLTGVGSGQGEERPGDGFESPEK